MTSLSLAVQGFASVLTGAWDGICALAKEVQPQHPEGFVADWMQATWEMLVEAAAARHKPVFLEVYGDGADCNPRSSRVFRPEALPTHTVNCVAAEEGVLLDALTRKPISLPEAGLPLDRLVRVTSSGWYEEGPPFDHALMYIDGREVVVSARDLDFILKANEEETG